MSNLKDEHNRGTAPTREERRRETGYDSLPVEASANPGPAIAPPTDEQTIQENLHGINHYTVDQDGLMNNYPVEPEMYFEVPGDAREENEAEKAARAEERREVTENSLGNPDGEEEVGNHGKGVGII